MSLLILDNIVKEYRSRLVLNGASLKVEKGERVALVGPNGSGKTTLLRIAAGTETCDSGNVILTRNTKMGCLTQDLRDMDPDGRSFRENALYHEEVSRLEQKLKKLEALMAGPELREQPGAYEKIFSEYSRLLNRYESLDGYVIEAKIKSVLLGLGLKEDVLTLPVELLSGGEKIKVAFARIMLEEPELLILDEPTNHLDIKSVEWLEGFLKRFDGGVLVVSHDRYFLDQVATRVAELGNGTVTERSGNYSTFMEQKNVMMEFSRREQFRLKQEIRRESEVALQFKGMRKISAWKSRLKTVERLKQQLEVNLKETKDKNHLYRTAAPGISFGDIKHLSSEIAIAEGLGKVYGNSVLFRDVSFLIKGGEKVGIIGPNGCGKTTLLNILLGKDNVYQGFGKLGQWVRYGFLGQETEFEDEDRTVLEELLAAQDMQLDNAMDYLAGFQFYGEDVNKKIGVLSGGERVRLYLGCIMLEKPDCLIMDEPTNHLDVPARDALEAALNRFKGTVIAISHDRYFLNRCINRILEFSGDTIEVWEGNYDSYRIKKEAAREGRQKRQGEGNKRQADGRPQAGESGAESGKPRMAGAPKEHGDSKVKQDAGYLEERISGLEGKRKELEASFGAGTPPETYVEYDALIQELEGLYELYTG